MERSKKTKLYFHDTRSKVESTKEDHKLKSFSPLEEQKESQPLRISKGNHDPMDVDSTKRKSSDQASWAKAKSAIGPYHNINSNEIRHSTHLDYTLSIWEEL